MKQTDKMRTPTNNQTKRPVRSQSKDNKLQQEKTSQPPKAKTADTKTTSEEVSLNIKNVKLTDQEAEDGREESDTETVTDSVSSSGDSLDTVPIVSKTHANKGHSENSSSVQRVKSTNAPAATTSKKTTKSTNETVKNSADNNLKSVKVHPKLSSAPSSVSSEGIDEQSCEEQKEVDTLNDDETNQKIEEMEMRIEKLEEELREVAALEISLYSVVPEHGSSAHKVHTPARRLSRLYIHAAKHYSQAKRATIAKNTSSGLVLIAKSCGNDVPRLSFWWSNTIALREIKTQAFGSSCQSSSLTRVLTSNGSSNKKDGKSKPDFIEFMDDWQETRTFTSALEKVESWIFSRTVESIWWQTLTPKMQSLGGDTNTNQGIGKLLGSALGNQQQVNFPINLWRIAFHDAFKRLCPVRAGGHECGLPPRVGKNGNGTMCC